jgi:hypothetical protein
LNRRGIFSILFGTIAAIGFAILIASRNTRLSYAATYLCAIGLYPCVANNVAWIMNNIEGVYKRGIFIAAVISWANINGLMSSNVYRQSDEPWYRLGHSIVFGYVAIGLVGGSILLYICLSIANKQRAEGGELLRQKILSGLTEEEEEDLADFHPDFRYTL